MTGDTRSRSGEILARAHELAAAHPELELSEAVTLAGYQIAAGVAKAASDPITLAEWAGDRIAQLQAQTVRKSGGSYVTATRTVAEEHPGLVALKYCGVACLPKDEAVVELVKAVAAERDQAEKAVMVSWLAELR
jgi:hypothetical protein